MRLILNAAPLALRPSFELKAFSGIRTEEMIRFWWVFVKELEKVIQIPKEIAKLKFRTLPIVENLQRRLAVYDSATKRGRVCKEWNSANSLYHAWLRVFKTAGVAYKKNAFRDCYITYRLTEDSTTVSSAAGGSRMDPRLAMAIARGEAVRRELAAAEGGSMSIPQAARLLGISKGTVLRRWRTHRLVAWKHGRSLRIPVWQFAGGKLLPGIEEVLQIFQSNDQWRLMVYFFSNRRSLAGRRPLDLLREAKVAEVVAHAKVYATENTW